MIIVRFRLSAAAELRNRNNQLTNMIYLRAIKRFIYAYI